MPTMCLHMCTFGTRRPELVHLLLTSVVQQQLQVQVQLPACRGASAD
jgi:hypothetical protein